MNPYEIYDYSALLGHQRSIVDLQPSLLPAVAPATINIIIGAMGRKEHLDCCLKYLVEALRAGQVRANILLVEIDNSSLLRSIAFKYQVNYVFVPLYLLHTNNKFSRGLAFDIGFMALPPATWVMNLDCDLLMPEDFFSKVQPRMQAGVTHIQPYADRRVRRASQTLTNQLFQTEKTADLHLLTDYSLPGRGACGGAIIVSYDAYTRVGGYDEFFYDWAPEDQLFFLKLECLHGFVNSEPDAHKGNCAYVEDTFLLHLEHEKLWETNPQLGNMEKMYNMFCQLQYDNKMQYIRKKAELFIAQKEKM